MKRRELKWNCRGKWRMTMAALLTIGAFALGGSTAYAAGDVAINESNFPDAKFRSFVSEEFDKDGNGSLNEAEIDAATNMEIAGNEIENGGITSLKGIEYFTNLKELDCRYNQIDSLDISKNKELNILICGGNPLGSLDVSNNTALNGLFCYSNQLSSLDVSNNPSLIWLSCFDNQLSSLDVSNNTELDSFWCYENKLTSLDVSKCTSLMTLECHHNLIEQLDLCANEYLNRAVLEGKKENFIDLVWDEELSQYVMGSALEDAWQYSFVEDNEDSQYIEYFLSVDKSTVVLTAENQHIKDMYRLYNPNSGEHFYTANAEEKDYLASIGWNYEGIAWKAPEISNTPVYRLYNPNAGDHHYTTSAAERDMLVSVGWSDEGIGWYSDDAEGEPLYRLYNPNATQAGAHHYTTNAAERDYLVSIGWNDEGIGWYGGK